jgi:hypothetical protein
MIEFSMLTYPHNIELLSAPGMCSDVVEHAENAASILPTNKAVKSGQVHNTCITEGHYECGLISCPPSSSKKCVISSREG